MSHWHKQGRNINSDKFNDVKSEVCRKITTDFVLFIIAIFTAISYPIIYNNIRLVKIIMRDLLLKNKTINRYSNCKKAVRSQEQQRLFSYHNPLSRNV